ncbi:MAG: hypothetical protein ABS34_04600 [Opitutaceae bacterium BACL24 MAG-120322-bin51]|nr:MAG: hypothetical protein ABS34_04600 [Opitutaceae bacterium BACL24 MAG-120322-bin51]
MKYTTPYVLYALLLSALPQLGLAEETPYVPSEENFAAREAFQDAKFGMFIHWGVYSIPAAGEWVMNKRNINYLEYKKYAQQFNPTEFDAQAIVLAAKNAGMKYITITTRHHDGFAMWHSESSDWDVDDASPYDKDIIKEMATACKQHDIKLFFYYSHLDWSHTDYFPRGRTGKGTGRPEIGDFRRYSDYMLGQLSELLNGDYGDVAGVWFDGWWDHHDDVDWRLRETYDLIHQLQPSALVGNNHHRAPFPGEDFQMFERDLPGGKKFGATGEISDALPLETCDTINGNWGFSKTDTGYKSKKQLIHYLLNTAHNNANLLLNVGPKPDGALTDGSLKALQGMGEWMQAHGNTIYGTRGSYLPKLSFGKMTTRKSTDPDQADIMYLHVTNFPEDGIISLPGMPNLKVRKAWSLANNSKRSITWKHDTLNTHFDISDIPVDPIDTIIVVEHDTWEPIKLPAMPALEFKTAPKPGLHYKLHEGVCNVVKEIMNKPVIASGVTETISLAPSTLRNDFGLNFSGYLQVPKTDTYTFSLTSDDGSSLTIDGRPCINHDGLHGASEKSFTTDIAEGWHTIEVSYFDAGGGSALELSWQSKDMPKQSIPASALAH